MFFASWSGFFEACGYVVVALISSWLAFARDRSRGRKRCPKCWYDMSVAVALRCPECGHQCASERELERARMYRWPLVVGATICLSIFVGVNRAALRAGQWTRTLPSALLYATVEPDYNTLQVMQRSGSWGVPWSFVGELRMELARRHGMGELPEWMWRRLTLNNFDMPSDTEMQLQTRAIWLRGVPIVVGTNALNLWQNRRQQDGLWKHVEIQLRTEYPGAGLMGFMQIDRGFFGTYGYSNQARYALNSQLLPSGDYEIPVTLVFHEGTMNTGTNRLIEVFRQDQVIRVRIVDDIAGIMTGVNDQASNDAVAQAAVIHAKNDRAIFDLKPLKFAVAFRLVFIANGIEIARLEDQLIPSNGGDIQFTDHAMRAKYMPRDSWDPRFVSEVTVRVESRPEACLPQLDYDKYWSGSFERPLTDFLPPSTGP